MKTQNQKLPPHNIDAEKHVLGALLVNEAAYDDIADILGANDFYVGLHRKIFSVIQGLIAAQEPCNTVTAAEILKQKDIDVFTKLGDDYLVRLANEVETSANIVFFAKIVAEASKKRQVIAFASNIANQGFDENIPGDDLLNNAQRELNGITDSSKVKSYTSTGEQLKGSMARLKERFENKSPVTGVPSGLADLDRMTAGFQPGDLIILAARPSMGKTSLALNLATHVASEIKTGAVGVFSIEMSTDNLMDKFISSMSRIDFDRIRTGQLVDTDWLKLQRAANTLYTSPILIDDTSSLTINQLRTKARKMKRDNDLKLIIIDYLQLMRTDTKAEARHLEIAEISRSLKALAKELNIPIVALSQLNRVLENRSDKRPIMG